MKFPQNRRKLSQAAHARDIPQFFSVCACFQFIQRKIGIIYVYKLYELVLKLPKLEQSSGFCGYKI